MRRVDFIKPVFLACLLGGILTAQTTVPQDQIPTDAPKTVVKKIRAMYSEDPKARLDAVISLMKMGPKAAAAVPFLIGILADNAKVEVRIGNDSVYVTATGQPGLSAVKALAAIGTDSFQPTLEALDSKEQIVRLRAVEVLGELKDRRAIKKLVELLRGDDVEIHKAVIMALETITGEKRGEDPTSWESFIY